MPFFFFSSFLFFFPLLSFRFVPVKIYYPALFSLLYLSRSFFVVPFSVCPFFAFSLLISPLSFFYFSQSGKYSPVEESYGEAQPPRSLLIDFYRFGFYAPSIDAERRFQTAVLMLGGVAVSLCYALVSGL